MIELKIRKMGGSNIISIPMTIVKMMGLKVNSVLELRLEDGKIFLTPKKEGQNRDVNNEQN